MKKLLLRSLFSMLAISSMATYTSQNQLPSILKKPNDFFNIEKEVSGIGLSGAICAVSVIATYKAYTSTELAPLGKTVSCSLGCFACYSYTTDIFKNIGSLCHKKNLQRTWIQLHNHHNSFISHDISMDNGTLV